MGKLLIINVLSPEYYNDCHIVGSINVPLEKLKDFAQKLDKETNIVVHCSSYMCKASVEAWKILHELGFKNVWAYEGGINEWYHLGLPVDGMCKQKYLVETIEKNHEEQEIAVINAEELKKMMAEHEREGASCCR